MLRINRIVVAVMIGLLAGCATAPKNEAKKEALDANVQATLTSMKADDPSFDKFLGNAYGYVVFPSVGKGGLIVGGAYGRGQVYEEGRMIGYADITQATLGLQAGGQSFAEVIVFENKAALDKFVQNRYEPSASASAVALKSGAAAAAKYTDGVALFTYVKGGLMAEASLGGQRFTFTPVR
jgi:lipid-binding SYLF domain-containing protein